MSDGWTAKGAERSVALSVATIFVAVFVFHADLHATAGPIFIVTPVVSVPVRAVPASIVAIAPFSVSSAVFVAIPIRITVAMHSPVWTHFAVFAAHTVALATTHPPVAPHLAVVRPRLVAIGSLISLLLRTLVRLGRNRLRRCDRRFALLLGERGAEARRREQDSGDDSNTHEIFSVKV
ncbi:hypothetical protein [Bradyrhizobium sp. AUGA SZCCT0431]|uniref:hypothetical protein n=1 Tax=Bradyrhizobium sp. AUGA SZCCT0431 TaxID=2807674 RepID=UPI001BA70654|nr:hypothetical protein [Bradyrhizobium sp. AUGA SZCCT0431]MBR1148865.1 hypothetical protein [Bradyrhizobium sp. AUGA SZCCT0431]